MNEQDHSTPSDLIYLYLDGETTGVQQSVLFSALAVDSDLQAEFTDAIRIRAAIESERPSAQPPAYLTANLFESAGFGAVVESTTSSGVVGPFLRRFGPPLAAAVLGSVITFLLVSDGYDRQYREVMSQLDKLRSERPIVDASRSTSELASSPESGRTLSQLDSVSSHALPATPVNRSRTSASQRSGFMSENRSAPEMIGATPSTDDVRAALLDETVALTPAVVDVPPSKVEPIAMQELATDIHTDASWRDVSEARLSPAMPVPPLLSDGLSGQDAQEHRVSLQLRGISNTGFYPDRPLENGAQPVLNNLSIGGLYGWSSEHWVGLEVGQESLPLYRSSGSTSEREPRILWVGGVYQFRGDKLLGSGNVGPFAQTTVGATASGPIGKAIAGITYTPDRRVSLSVGFEGTALFYRLRGDWYSTRKTGVTYVMNIHF